MIRYILSSLLVIASMLSAKPAEKLRSEVRYQSVDITPAIFDVESDFTRAQLELCFTMPEKHNSGAMSVSSIELLIIGHESDTINVSAALYVHDYSDIYEKRVLDVCVDDKLVARYDHKLSGAVNLYGGDNYMLLSVESGKAALYIGCDRLNYCTTIDVTGISRFIVRGTKDVELVSGVLEMYVPVPLSERLSKQMLAAISNERGKTLTGTWTYLDRDNDPDFARIGGKYTIAIEPAESDGIYNIYYVSGADVNSSRWKSGMLKGRLSPLPLTGRYRLEWWDSEMNKVDEECHASLEDGLLSLHFPLLHTVIRFSPESVQSHRSKILFR